MAEGGPRTRSGTTVVDDRLTRLVLVALAFSWLGDTVPALTDGDTAMLVLIVPGSWPARRGPVHP